ncbi:precorrin-3 methyltransferase [Rubrobacter xylanophilus DSM 9941]|uniref:Precorrin-3 methyltransferase n=1 Tax=Rubrobacter xylanophilus (strain DSM 9941 / JCM 11954 / NBRC 16129 / PRD-1) TaxID=266117 RepID=Q1AYB5_RUBXD|nr:precorrin-3B C(17)-methyltransferase [Rubrobacter xylanophilus]ABG03613.1 precorrin-3 methyltransferase [Rubrobacter xylanophilus DSM 9941]
MIGLVAATENGRRRARHLARAWPDARLYGGRPGEAVRRAWGECGGLVLFMAAGAAVRLVAPLLSDKRRDPGVVCVDDAGRHAVSLCGGHGGGANALARRVAGALGAGPVITTASEALGVPALDSLGAELGFRIEEGSDLAAVGAALVGGETVRLVSERRWPLGPLPENVVRSGEPEPPLILISDRAADPPRPAVVYRPPSLVAGVGCSRGAGAEEILGLLRPALQGAGLSPKSLCALASVEAKRGERGLLEAAESLGVTLRLFPAQRLARQPAPNPSRAVERAVGTPSVAEAAVLACGATLLVEKRRSKNATVAVGRLPVRGRLYIVGLGPGDEGLLPPLARRALSRAELVVGLERYVGRIRHLLRPGTRVATPPLGEEVERARLALEEARAGGSAALVSGGDAGVYGMASPALELAGEEVEVEVVPGITAAQAASALLGAPLGHDHCALSLSDLLTPWEVIERRLRAVAEADLVVSLYNPRSGGRGWQLERARRILLERRPPETPVGVVRNAFREGQRVALTSLGSLRTGEADMNTIVVVGSSRTRVRAGRMVTPRGYAG